MTFDLPGEVSEPHIFTQEGQAVTMSLDGVKVLATTIVNSSQVSIIAPVAAGRSRVVVDVSTSRVVRPIDYGGADPRELGAMVQWEFVDEAR